MKKIREIVYSNEFAKICYFEIFREIQNTENFVKSKQKPLNRGDGLKMRIFMAILPILLASATASPYVEPTCVPKNGFRLKSCVVIPYDGSCPLPVSSCPMLDGCGGACFVSIFEIAYLYFMILKDCSH